MQRVRSLKPMQAVGQVFNALGARLDSIKILGRPLTWFVSGWRLAIIAFAVAIAYPQIDNDQSLMTGFIGVGVYVIMALGLNIVVGYAGLLDLGYVAFFVIGNYVAAVGSGGVILNAQGQVVNIPIVPFWLLLIGGALIAGFFGVLLGAPTLRLRGDYLAIVTLGFGEIVPIVFNNVPFFYGALGISAAPPPDFNTPFFSLTFSNPLDVSAFYYLVLGIVVVVVFLVVLLRDSSIGRAWIAIREDETAAAAAGVNLVRTKLLAFGLGALIGGVAGVLNASFNNDVTPSLFNFEVSISVLAMIVLGGIGSIAGVIVGAIILQFLNGYLLQKLNDYVHGPGAQVPGFLASIDFNQAKFLVFGIIMVLMILLRPQGIIPDRRRQRELKEASSVDSASAVGALAIEEAGDAISGLGDTADVTEYVGPGSDAQGREG
jgi:ABC-type branched-subunit amino acid transport system permease subunit